MWMHDVEIEMVALGAKAKQKMLEDLTKKQHTGVGPIKRGANFKT